MNAWRRDKTSFQDDPGTLRPRSSFFMPTSTFSSPSHVALWAYFLKETMAWIESHINLERHPKTLKLKSLLGTSLEHTIGVLHRLWYWTLNYAEDGILEKYGVKGLSEALELDATKLIEAGFVDCKPCMRVHDWWCYAGRYLQSKYKNYPLKWKSVQRAYLGRTKAGLSPKLPIITNQSSPTNPPLPPKGDGQFDAFWNAYPKKVGKGAAEKSWGRISSVEAIFEKIMGAVAAQSQSGQWTKDNGQYIPHPSTWLNQKRWEDEVMSEQTGVVL